MFAMYIDIHISIQFDLFHSKMMRFQMQMHMKTLSILSEIKTQDQVTLANRNAKGFNIEP